MNKEALRYYGIKESSYRDLSDPKTDFMNLGIWPTDNLIEAQKRLVEVTVQQGICHVSDAESKINLDNCDSSFVLPICKTRCTIREFTFFARKRAFGA